LRTRGDRHGPARVVHEAGASAGPRRQRSHQDVRFGGCRHHRSTGVQHRGHNDWRGLSRARRSQNEHGVLGTRPRRADRAKPQVDATFWHVLAGFGAVFRRPRGPSGEPCARVARVRRARGREGLRRPRRGWWRRAASACG